ncbi:hypothetical protein TWF281_003079 [Arthrobotrys megalospora]
MSFNQDLSPTSPASISPVSSPVPPEETTSPTDLAAVAPSTSPSSSPNNQPRAVITIKQDPSDSSSSSSSSPSSSRVKELENELAILKQKYSKLEKEEMQSQKYLAASVEDYTKLCDKIYHLRKKNSSLQAELEKKDAIIRGLKREAEIVGECHDHQINTVHLQAALRFEPTKEAFKEVIHHLEVKLAAATGRSSPPLSQTRGELPSTPPPIPHYHPIIHPGEPGQEEEEAQDAGLDAGSPSPPSARPNRPNRRPTDEEPAGAGPVRRFSRGGRRPTQSAPRPQQQQQRHHYQFCSSFLKTGTCGNAACTRTHESRLYPTWSKGYRSGLPCHTLLEYGFCPRPGRCDYNHEVEAEDSTNPEPATTAAAPVLTGGGGGSGRAPGRKRTQPTFGVWSTSSKKQKRGEEEEEGEVEE